MKMPSTLVTGASGGLGLEIARRFAQRHDHLVITARSADTLEAAAAELRALGAMEVTAIPGDLGHREGARFLLDELARRQIVVGTLVNNAGFGLSSPFLSQDADEQLEMLDLNIAALTLLTRTLLPPMVAAGRGEVMNVASVAGFQPGPFMAVYYATKAYVLSLSEALREELRGTGIRIVTLCPGPTHTGFAARAGLEHSLLFKGTVMEAGPVVDRAMRALHGGGLVVPGFRNKLLVQSQRLVPRSIPLRITRQLNARRIKPA